MPPITISRAPTAQRHGDVSYARKDHTAQRRTAIPIGPSAPGTWLWSEIGACALAALAGALVTRSRAGQRLGVEEIDGEPRASRAREVRSPAGVADSAQAANRHTAYQGDDPGK